MRLTEEQEEVVNAIQGLYETTNRIAVSGAGGTGKSFSITKGLKNHKALFLTPTHAAAEVLKRELPSEGDFKVGTVHSFCGWFAIERFDGTVSEGCKDVSKGVKKDDWMEASVVIVDEASLVSKLLWRNLEKYCEHYKLPIVLSGDASQLNPVGEQFNVFSLGFTTYTLTKNMRFSEDSGIAKVCETLRSKIDRKDTKPFKIPNLPEWEDVLVLDEAQWLEQMKASYDKEENAIAIAYDHSSLKKIREHLTGEAYLYEDGQEVRCLKSSNKFKSGETLEISQAGSAFKADFHHTPKELYSARPAWMPKEVWQGNEIPLSFQLLDFSNGKTAAVIGDELTDTTIKNVGRKLKKTGKKLGVQKTEAFNLSFLRTCHTSQGGSWDTVYVHTPSVLIRSGTYLMRENALDWLSLVYVSCSRAKLKLVLMEYPS